MRSAGDTPSVLIISAAMGAGHDGVAYELQRRLRARGADADVVDYLELLPGRLGPFYRAFYQGQLKYAPSSYEWLYGKMDRGLMAPAAAWFGQMGQRRVKKLARGHDVVISTYPLGCQATGALRQKGKLKIPAVGFLTDVDVHALWLHPGVDLNLTVWHGSAVEAINRVGSPSRAVGPVLPDAFLEPPTDVERKDGRVLMGLDEDATAVLVVAGSWGVGDIAGTARAIRDSGAGTPVVLCGRNEDLHAQLDQEDGVVAIGWTTEVRRLLAASDAIVHNAGGLSCLEGFAIGVPVIGHACLPGHGHRNAEAMRNANVAAYAETTDDLIAEVRRLARTDEGTAMAARARALFQADPTDTLLRIASEPVPERRVAPSPAKTFTRRLARVAVGVPVTVGALSFGVAEATALGHVGVAEGHDHAVYVAAIVDHAQATDPRVVAAMRSLGVSAAVAPTANGVTPTDIRTLVTDGVTVVATDNGVHSRNPKRQSDAIRNAIRAVSATNERPKVVCLTIPGMGERFSAWENAVLLAHADAVLTDGQSFDHLRAGKQIVLDERGRTAQQVAADLTAFAKQVRAAQLAEMPMHALWPTA